MSNIPVTSPEGNGPWRLLLLSRNPEDPMWLIATVTMPADVRPAVLDAAGRYQDWEEVTQWVRAALGWPEVALVPVMDPVVWRVDEGGKPR